MPRILALDHGSARCGCAISDPSGTLATPLRTVEREPALAGAAAHEFFVDRFAVAYRAQMVAFADAVRSGAGPADTPCSGRDAQMALRIAIAAERSRSERRPVTVAEITAANDPLAARALEVGV